VVGQRRQESGLPTGGGDLEHLVLGHPGGDERVGRRYAFDLGPVAVGGEDETAVARFAAPGDQEPAGRVLRVEPVAVGGQVPVNLVQRNAVGP
jgi:hypothetical protein